MPNSNILCQSLTYRGPSCLPILPGASRDTMRSIQKCTSNTSALRLTVNSHSMLNARKLPKSSPVNVARLCESRRRASVARLAKMFPVSRY